MTVTCGIYFIDKNGLLLVCKATGGGWSIPKGLLEPDESLYDAAKRELFEETNVDLHQYVFKQFCMLPERKYKKRNKKLISYAVQVNVEHENIMLRCNSFFIRNGKQFPEIESFAWATLESAENLLHESQIENLHIIKTKFKI
jgi:ADP-ribose pyrophosphatase YjhB (NUDIX family)